MLEKKHKLDLEVQYADTRLEGELTEEMLRRWVEAALLGPAELSIRFVDAEEGQSLNRQYRGKDYATNVLTFDYAHEPVVVADLILCAPVVEREARDEGKTLADHAAHLIVHGTLHLLGYDHESTAEAEIMEGLEVKALKRLKIADPYRDTEPSGPAP